MEETGDIELLQLAIEMAEVNDIEVVTGVDEFSGMEAV